MLLANPWYQRKARGHDDCAVGSGLGGVAAAAVTVRAAATAIADGRGSRRIQHDLASVLQTLSGKEIGTNPQSWRTWWRAVSDGQLEFAEPGAEPPAPSSRSASFFGLRPVSSRVTFVLDHSGSMTSRWPGSGHTRYVEAIEQLLRYLQAAGPDTLYNVVLFDSNALLSTPHLVPATPENLELTRKSLLRRSPDGSTNLYAGIRKAFLEDGKGRIDVSRIEADTVVVLCDGVTDAGPAWIDPFLDRWADEARIVFHCVFLGDRSDGALERLARRTGGDFIQAGG